MQTTELLLNISEAMARIRGPQDLLEVVHLHLKRMVDFNDLVVSVIDHENGTWRFMLIDADPVRKAHVDYDKIMNRVYDFPEQHFTAALQSARPMLFDMDEILKHDVVPEFVKWGYANGAREYVTVTLRDADRPIGFLHLVSNVKNTFQEEHLQLIQGIASQFSTAVSNILINQALEQRQQETSLLLSFSNDLAGAKDKDGLGTVISRYLWQHFKLKGYVIIICEPNGEFTPFLQEQVPGSATDRLPYDQPMIDQVLASEEPVIFDIKGKQLLGIRLRAASEDIGVLWTQPADPDSRLYKGISAQIAIALSNVLANAKVEMQLAQIKRYKVLLEEENLYLHEQINSNNKHSEIIGTNESMRKIYDLISEVAYTSSTVLILGETGTGKELVARAVHQASPRKNKLMVKVNCSALPATLIESELFGHERGSFTGAIEQRIGKFELANNGTLFLDEIGELSADLQVKLLRVLQEKEIERVGGRSTIKVNVRIIAATNRDLAKEMKEGRFRSDLYYRLHVFPITIPPLRERKEDIPVLSAHFVQRYARNSGKIVESISKKAMEEMMAYDWPGNIRELEHLIERSVLLTKGAILKEMYIPFEAKRKEKPVMEESPIRTMIENERDHILYVLRKCNGKVFGHGGAAEMLDIHVSTLNSKMKKLGIEKKHIFEVKTKDGS